MPIETTNSLKDCPSNVTCEADGCNAEATFKITLKVGTSHAIHLFLCRTCKPKFCSDGDDSVQVLNVMNDTFCDSDTYGCNL